MCVSLVHNYSFADSDESVVVSIRAKASEFDERFSIVVSHTRYHLHRREKEQDDFLTQFKMMLKDLSLGKKHGSYAFWKEIEKIESATSSDEIIDIIDPYWSFSNCGFLRCIINEFGTRELKQEMETYITDVEEFQKTTEVKDWYMATVGEAKTAEHYERLSITLNEDWEERTLYDVYQFKKDLDIKAAITNEAASPVIDFDIGSLKIVMAFAPVVVPEVEVVIEDPQFRLSHNIVEAVWLPSPTSSLPQPSSQPSLDNWRLGMYVYHLLLLQLVYTFYLVCESSKKGPSEKRCLVSETCCSGPACHTFLLLANEDVCLQVPHQLIQQDY